MVAANSVRDRHAELLAWCRNEAAGDGFLDELARRLSRLVPFDASLFVATDPATNLPGPPIRIERVDEDCRTFWERELLVEDVLLFRDLARRPIPAGTIRRVTDDHPSRSTRHRELNAPNGFDDELRVAFRAGSHTWGVASLWRLRGRPPFSGEELDRVAEVAGAIGESFRRAVLHPGPGDPAGSAAPGLLLFDAEGHLEELNHEAAGWLDELGPNRGPWSLERIPTEICSVVSQARAVAADLAAGPARSRVRSRTGRWLAVHATCLRDTDGRVRRTAVVIEPARSVEIAPLMVQAYGLTERERDVTGMIARGISTAEIAEALFLSPHTVRGYVKAVLEKVGVGSRGELVAKLFDDHFYDPLHR